MTIKMRALQTFIGAEGLIKKGSEFFVTSEPRADQMQRAGLAARTDGKETPDEKPVIGPSETQDYIPQQQPAAPPENAPFEGLTVDQLKDRARIEKIKGYKSMTKAKLIDVLTITLKSKGEL